MQFMEFFLGLLAFWFDACSYPLLDIILMHFVGETDSNFFNKKFLCPDEGQDEYEKDGFIVDDVDEEEEQDEEERAESDE